jgi:hypothetical protein
MVEIYNQQYLWDNRQYPRVHAMPLPISGVLKSYGPTIDRANLNFPLSAPGLSIKDLFIGIMILKPNLKMFRVYLALADQTRRGYGRLSMRIPELYRTYDTWKLTQPDDPRSL